MIPIIAQPEPASFDSEVRQKGLAWLNKNQIDLNKPLPENSNIEPYWRNCLDEMYLSYHGCCAYLAVFFERVTGAGSVDHFIAKSQRADLAYEWHNYRLACSRMNSRKRDYDDVIDPFEMQENWFHLELVSGHIYPNKDLNESQGSAIQASIKRLGLDDEGNKEMRARHYQEYCEGYYTADFLKKRSPFVWYEAQRQGLL